MKLYTRTPDLCEGIHVIAYSDEPEGYGCAGWIDLQTMRKLYGVCNLKSIIDAGHSVAKVT